MLDVLSIRFIAGIILVSFLATIYIASRARDSKDFYKFVPLIEKRPGMNYYLWRVLMHVPLVAVIIAIPFPEVVYNTLANVRFEGDTFLQIAGFFIFIFGGILFYECNKHLGRHMVSRSIVLKNHSLVTTGPYAKIRHPTYTSYLLLNIGIAILLLNLILVILFFGAVVTTAYKARSEEDLLSSGEAFGQRYRDYMKQTGRFFPNLIQ
jgi:protein-S-isoprenylcysteine O-methyltransferase Ste14